MTFTDIRQEMINIVIENLGEFHQDLVYDLNFIKEKTKHNDDNIRPKRKFYWVVCKTGTNISINRSPKIKEKTKSKDFINLYMIENHIGESENWIITEIK